MYLLIYERGDYIIISNIDCFKCDCHFKDLKNGSHENQKPLEYESFNKTPKYHNLIIHVKNLKLILQF